MPILCNIRTNLPHTVVPSKAKIVIQSYVSYNSGALVPSAARLHMYAQRKELVINAAKYEIVHFNSRGDNVPVFTLRGARLACADSFKCLGMLFTKHRGPYRGFMEPGQWGAFMQQHGVDD
eukprot:1106441-Pelagomonas_calceolata.AAC.2